MFKVFLLIWFICACVYLYNTIKKELIDKEFISLGELAILVLIALISPAILIFELLVKIINSNIWGKPIIRKKEEKQEEEVEK